MINQSDLPAYIQQTLPELTEVCKDKNSCNIYRLIRQLFKYTASELMKNNKIAAQRCFSLAEQLYTSGNKAIKNAIENVYVYSFSHAFFCDAQKRRQFLSVVPKALYTLYKQQVSTSHL